jgi:hypothetical protein
VKDCEGNVFLPGYVANPILTDREKEMWKDVLDPTWKKTVDKNA